MGIIKVSKEEGNGIKLLNYSLGLPETKHVRCWAIKQLN